MALNFPSSPVDQQAHAGWIYFTSVGAWKRYAGTALDKNRVVNSGQQVSEQNGIVQSTIASVNSAGYYAADEWRLRWNLSTGSLFARSWDIANILGHNAVYFHVDTAQASLGAAEYALVTNVIEGNRVADLMWGTANAQNAVLRFNVAATNGVGGTFSVRLANSDSSRSYIATFTLLANVWKTVELQIPGDVTGTWLKDNGVGIRIDWVFGIGSNYVAAAGTENTWQAGNLYAMPGQTNGMASAGADFIIGAVGLYVDPLKTGKAPEYQSSHIEEDFQDCLRYWYKGYRWEGVVNSATNGYLWQSNYVPMRVAPSLSLVGLNTWDGSTVRGLSALSSYNTTVEMTSFLGTVSGGLVAGRGHIGLVNTQTANYVAVNARMT